MEATILWSPSIHAWAENSNTTQYKPITLTKGLRDPTGMSVLVFLMIYADCRLFTQWLPPAFTDLCTANSVRTAQMVFLVLQRIPKSALWLGQMLRAYCFSSKEKTPESGVLYN